jgi:quercetin dioxygenase-like cupin family protein
VPPALAELTASEVEVARPTTREASGPSLRQVEAGTQGGEMIRTGDTIQNPVTGERITFLATSRDTDGEAVVIETVVQPKGFVAAAHVHPFQSERFAVAEGKLGLKVAGKKRTLGPGEIALVEPGKAHRFWNAGEDEVRFVCEIRPALEFESLLETMFGLAADGRTNRKGMPNPLRLAVIAQAHFATVRLPFPPAWLQKAGLALAAPVGLLLGYRPTYEPAAGTAAVAAA